MNNLVPEYEHYRAQVIEMACDQGMSNSAIGEKLGFHPSTIRMWLQRPEYIEATKLYYTILEEETFRLAAVNKSKRVQVLQEQLDKLLELQRQRAEAYSSVLAGGDTGLLVKHVKTVGTGQNAYDVAEYEYDSAVTRDIMGLHKQIAIEMGQWSEKSEHNINVTEQIKVIRFEKQTRPEDSAIDADYREVGD